MPLSPLGITSGTQKLKTCVPRLNVAVMPLIVTEAPEVLSIRMAPASSDWPAGVSLTTLGSPNHGVGKNPLGRRLSAYPTKTEMLAALAGTAARHSASMTITTKLIFVALKVVFLSSTRVGFYPV